MPRSASVNAFAYNHDRCDSLLMCQFEDQSGVRYGMYFECESDASNFTATISASLIEVGGTGLSERLLLLSVFVVIRISNECSCSSTRERAVETRNCPPPFLAPLYLHRGKKTAARRVYLTRAPSLSMCVTIPCRPLLLLLTATANNCHLYPCSQKGPLCAEQEGRRRASIHDTAKKGQRRRSLADFKDIDEAVGHAFSRAESSREEDVNFNQACDQQVPVRSFQCH